MKRKPVLLKKQRKQEIKKENISKEEVDKKVIQFFKKQIIGVYDNGEFASEFSLFISHYTTLKVLLIDANALTPVIAETLGIKNTYNTNIVSEYKTKSSFNMAMDFIAKEKANREIFKSICVKHKDFYVLTGNDDIKQYEYYTKDAFKDLIKVANECFDIVIINTNSCIYDAFFVDTMSLCDTMIYAVELTADKIKMVNSYVQFIYDNMGIEKDRHKIIGFNYNSLHMDKLDVKTVTDENLIGIVSYDPERIRKRNKFDKQYKMNKKVKNDYRKISKYFNIGLKKGHIWR
ncbi:hypothetical protein SH1V18_47840 [Vallitalea longa]|uniref:Uncharacterized protein n=1 Tax=Vallitalea longa TaxID=2936439 RepID=A0A9W5YI19_9FIRM|nr:hypothetical protein [Vallitalea longa]GKX32304.1 hypothetical protein SH1V18_47840 [Vallitalea longa]